MYLFGLFVFFSHVKWPNVYDDIRWPTIQAVKGNYAASLVETVVQISTYSDVSCFVFREKNPLSEAFGEAFCNNHLFVWRFLIFLFKIW